MTQAKLLGTSLAAAIMVGGLGGTTASACPAGMGLENTKTEANQGTPPTNDTEKVIQRELRTPTN
jgi:hypothetical protein